jgi:hypothetical protein
MAESDSFTDSEREPGRFRHAGFLAAAGFLVLVVVLAVAIFARSGGRSKSSKPPAAAPSTSSVPPASAGDCHLTDTDQQIPQTGPAATWTIYKTLALPTSPTAGPAIIAGDVARCYAHTPTGALFAAAQLDMRFVVADDWRKVVDQQVVPGPGRDAYIKDREAGAVSTDTHGVQLAGFKFVTYSPAMAVIQFAAHTPDGSYQSNTVTVAWSGTDWRLQLQPDGEDSPTFPRISSLDGFIHWGSL